MTRDNIARIWTDTNCIFIQTTDGKIGSEKFSDYSRLANSTDAERNHFKLSYYGIHWPELDEDLSYAGFFNK